MEQLSFALELEPVRPTVRVKRAPQAPPLAPSPAPPRASLPSQGRDPRLPPVGLGNSASSPVPPARQASWERWSAPLAAFLGREGKTWLELSAWGEACRVEGHVIRNLLVWMELHHKARAEALCTEVVWDGKKTSSGETRSLPGGTVYLWRAVDTR